jgi:hypothetical protein
MKKKYINIAIIIISIIIAGLIVTPYALEPFEEPSGKFFKINIKSDAKRTKVILISWDGCPIGASLSWPLYFALSHYGNVTVYKWHSDPADSFPDTPGLIFKNLQSNTVNATFIYLYNETLEGNSKNQSINANLITYGLNELKKELPNNEYQIIKKCETQKWIDGGFFQTSANSTSPHHLNTALLIIGNNGGYFLNGGLYSPKEIDEYSNTYLYENGKNITVIHNSMETILHYIHLASNN